MGRHLCTANAPGKTPHQSSTDPRPTIDNAIYSSYTSLDDWVQSSAADSAGDLMLQMDIEGHEYQVLLTMSKTVASRFRIIVAEFHGLDHLLSEPFFRIASSAFDKLLNTHSCVHIHPNNCCGLIQHAGIPILSMIIISFSLLTRPSGDTAVLHWTAAGRIHPV